MKQILYTIIFLTTSALSAQGLEAGVKAGLTFSNLRDISVTQQRSGFTAGVFAGVKFNDRFGFQAEMLYSQQGAEFDYGEFNLDYVAIPVLFKIYLTDRFHVDFGPQLGILLQEEALSVVNQIGASIETNAIDWSAVLGIGFDIPLGLRLEGRYAFGLTEVNNPFEYTAGLENILETGGKTSLFSLSLGYSFL